MKLKCRAATGMEPGTPFEPGLPLWSRAPTRDEDGHLLTDFMMLIPGLKERPAPALARTSRVIQRVLSLRQEVVFADLNLALNLLWVSLRPKRGAIIEIATAIRIVVPEAVLIAHHVPPSP